MQNLSCVPSCPSRSLSSDVSFEEIRDCRKNLHFVSSLVNPSRLQKRLPVTVSYQTPKSCSATCRLHCIGLRILLKPRNPPEPDTQKAEPLTARVRPPNGSPCAGPCRNPLQPPMLLALARELRAASPNKVSTCRLGSQVNCGKPRSSGGPFVPWAYGAAKRMDPTALA